MNFIKPFVITYLLIMINYRAQSQANYDIQLTLSTVDCINNTICYDVQLRSSDSQSWILAGQNYRLYYDGSLGSYISGVSLLDDSDYSSFTLIQNIQKQSAIGIGGLTFENNLSFLNYAIDLSNTSNGGEALPSDGTWLSTSQLCFSVQPTLLEAPTTCFEATWARSGLTDTYATSFVEVSEWVANGNTQITNGLGYNDLNNSADEASCFVNSCQFDYGDLQDATKNSINSIGYATYNTSNGPLHLIVPGLSLGTTVDADTNGIASDQALGDDMQNMDDEDGITLFPSLNISPGSTIRIPLSYTNTTGNTAYIEAWVDWNGDGDFLETDEFIFDGNDGDFNSLDRIEITIPKDVTLNQLLGFRIRISNQDNMTPYGRVNSGEVEDYLLQVTCPKNQCLPITANKKNKF